MFLCLRVAIASAVDEFIDHVVQPQQIGVRFVALKVVSGKLVEKLEIN